MAGGKSTPKKDIMLKVSGGQFVKTGAILSRGVTTYKPGKNVGGLGTQFALCYGKVYFSKRKTPHGRMRTFINVMPLEKKSK